jgi:uncharacterized membrane protein
VAIATALMPPLATVGFGLATGNAAIAGGAFALFATNFVTIALSATIMARLYGFGHYLSSQQSWLQTGLLIAVFVVMAVPLGLSLQRIAREAVTTTQVRAALSGASGKNVRITQLDIDFQSTPLTIRAVLIVPRQQATPTAKLNQAIAARCISRRSAGRSGADRSSLQRWTRPVPPWPALRNSKSASSMPSRLPPWWRWRQGLPRRCAA